MNTENPIIEDSNLESHNLESPNLETPNLENPNLENPTNTEVLCLRPEKVSPRPKGKLKNYVAVAVLCLALCGGSLFAGIRVGRQFENKTTATAEATAPVVTSNTVQLSKGSNDMSSIFKAVQNSVVSINTKATAANNFFQYGTYSGAGSGIVYGEDDSKIYIITNNHVIDSAQSVTVSFDGKIEVPANFVGNDAQSDLAIISLDKNEVKKAGVTDYSLASFGNSDQVEVGESVMAIGNALGEGKSITSGIISAKNKILNIDGKELNVIQTDAAINPGNSGGALVNSAGMVIGVNTAKYSSAGVEGMGYSIPSNVVKKIADEIIKNGSVQTPRLGIQGVTITEELKKMYGFTSDGVLVAGVEPGGPANKSGIQTGDIIVGLGETKISSLEDLQKRLAESKVGDNLKVYVNRDGIPVVLTTEIGDANKGQNF